MRLTFNYLNSITPLIQGSSWFVIVIVWFVISIGNCPSIKICSSSPCSSIRKYSYTRMYSSMSGQSGDCCLTSLTSLALLRIISESRLPSSRYKSSKLLTTSLDQVTDSDVKRKKNTSMMSINEFKKFNSMHNILTTQVQITHDQRKSADHST